MSLPIYHIGNDILVLLRKAVSICDDASDPDQCKPAQVHVMHCIMRATEHGSYTKARPVTGNICRYEL